jgi:hypothetical protein
MNLLFLAVSMNRWRGQETSYLGTIWKALHTSLMTITLVGHLHRLISDNREAVDPG